MPRKRHFRSQMMGEYEIFLLETSLQIQVSYQIRFNGLICSELCNTSSRIVQYILQKPRFHSKMAPEVTFQLQGVGRFRKKNFLIF